MAPTALGLRYLGVVLLAAAALGGCGESYRLDPACLNIVGTTAESKEQLLAVVSRLLGQEGFEAFGKSEEMIALMQQADFPDTVREEQLARLNRERTFLNRSSHLSVEWDDYTNEEPRSGSLCFTPALTHFVQIRIYDERPGGFGSNGHRFYSRFLSALREKYGTSVVVVKEPPQTNEAEYLRITIKNTIAAVIGWSIALLIPFAIIGVLSVFLLKRLKLSSTIKRLIFVVVNSWLVTPLPFPAAFIMVIPAPNLLAFPWTDLDYYRRVASYAAVSLPCTLVLCALVSLFLFKGTPNTRT
jgi:hypothetical protein